MLTDTGHELTASDFPGRQDPLYHAIHFIRDISKIGQEGQMLHGEQKYQNAGKGIPQSIARILDFGISREN